MIEFNSVSKTFWSEGRPTVIADRVTMTFPPGRSVALMGQNGAGKSTFLKMIAGTLRPSSGKVSVSGAVSWPIGFAGSFHGDLSGAQNTRFVARIYGVDTDALVNFVADTAGLGHALYAPFRTYSSGMKARLAFSVSMGIDFDTYLIDEVTSVGDAAFRDQCEALLSDRLATRGAIVVSHSLGLLERMCDAGVVLHKGQAMWFDDVEGAIARHRYNLKLG